MNTDRLLFLDIETTALDPREGAAILEVGVIVTDRQLVELERRRWLIDPGSGTRWDQWPLEQHGMSGLMRASAVDGLSRQEVEVQLCNFLDRHWPGCLTQRHKRPLLAGNSVHFDRCWLAALMPDVERRLHHRHLDLSSVWLFADHVAGLEGAARPRREVAHTAIEDLEACLKDARRYRALVRGEEVDCG